MDAELIAASCGLSSLQPFDLALTTRGERGKNSWASTNVRNDRRSPPTTNQWPYVVWCALVANCGCPATLRWTRVVGVFPDGQSCLNLAAARLRYIAGTAWSAKCYMNMRPLYQPQVPQTEAVA